MIKNEAVLISDDDLENVTGGFGYQFHSGRLGFVIHADCPNEKCRSFDVYPLIEEESLIGERSYDVSQNENWSKHRVVMFKCRNCSEVWIVKAPPAHWE